MITYTVPSGGGPPQNTALPVISGTAQVGQSLSVSNGSWNGNPNGFTYQWQSAAAAGGPFTDITGAAAAGYTVLSGDVDRYLRAVVTASNGAGSSSANSVAVGPVTPNDPPQNTAPPVISGTAQVGQSLSVSNGSWNGNPNGFTYQWQSAATAGGPFTDITGAAAAGYTVLSGDVNRYLRP